MIKYNIKQTDFEFFERYHITYPNSNLEIAIQLFNKMLDNTNEDDFPSYLFIKAVSLSKEYETLGSISLLDIATVFVTDKDWTVERRFRELYELNSFELGIKTKENFEFVTTLSKKFNLIQNENAKFLIRFYMQEYYVEELSNRK